MNSSDNKCFYIDETVISQYCMVVATVAVLKSRDMHWGLLAQKDHKDISLSSLRMLLVTDGANPCTRSFSTTKLT
jgi:hypothetical protein